jgi:hypothetical protein
MKEIASLVTPGYRRILSTSYQAHGVTQAPLFVAERGY